ncbi:MAG: anaerobic ribonucleoside-triphosphate reductase activating protein, partial [Rhodoferax sp.]
KLAAVVFVQGCPWRCGYCHNPHLQPRTASSPVPWRDVLDLLQRRVGLIDAVVFSGGEPTMDPALLDAMRAVRALGFGVGLHSAGMYPRRLDEVLPLVDWVGLDIKASMQGYDAITGIAGSARQVRTSLEQVLTSGVAYECRTTAHPALHTQADLLALAQALQAMGVRRYVLLGARATGCIDARINGVSTLGYPGPELLAQMAPLFDNFTVRQA